jgi:hypothetical protein
VTEAAAPRLTLGALALVLASGVVAGERPAAGLSEVTAGGWTLTLDGCALTADGPAGRLSHAFPFPPPCRFATRADAELQTVEVDGAAVLMVEAARTVGGRCDTRLQAVVVAPDRLAVSEEVQAVSACPGSGWDAKMFEILAQRTRPLDHRVDPGGQLPPEARDSRLAASTGCRSAN